MDTGFALQMKLGMDTEKAGQSQRRPLFYYGKSTGSRNVYSFGRGRGFLSRFHANARPGGCTFSANVFVGLLARLPNADGRSGKTRRTAEAGLHSVGKRRQSGRSTSGRGPICAGTDQPGIGNRRPAEHGLEEPRDSALVGSKRGARR